MSAVGDDVTTVQNAVGASYVGRLLAITGSNAGIVRIEPMASSQIEQVISVPLASSTSAATTNAVVITQRAIKVVSAQVAFNTVPNSGALDVGTDASDPDEIVDNFNLATLTANVAANLTLAGRDVAKNTRIWAKVGIATTTAGVGGVLTLRFFELP